MIGLTLRRLRCAGRIFSSYRIPFRSGLFLHVDSSAKASCNEQGVNPSEHLAGILHFIRTWRTLQEILRDLEALNIVTCFRS